MKLKEGKSAEEIYKLITERRDLLKQLQVSPENEVIKQAKIDELGEILWFIEEIEEDDLDDME